MHRLVVVEGEASTQLLCSFLPVLIHPLQEEERRGGKKGRLLGIITLSDVLRYVIGNVGISEGIEEELKPTQSDSTIRRTPKS